MRKFAGFIAEGASNDSGIIDKKAKLLQENRAMPQLFAAA